MDLERTLFYVDFVIKESHDDCKNTHHTKCVLKSTWKYSVPEFLLQEVIERYKNEMIILKNCYSYYQIMEGEDYELQFCLEGNKNFFF